MDNIPVGEDRSVQAGIDIINGTVAAFSYPAFHSSFKLLMEMTQERGQKTLEL
ncbi:hypothetical protein ES703_97276 [subsurface metagenome]